MDSVPGIKTRFLILSDTHGQALLHSPDPSLSVDVLIHSGDLTEESKLSEFRTTLDMLNSINASLKIVIAGNHDFTLDESSYKALLDQPGLEKDLVKKHYGAYGDSRAMFEEYPGIILLDEGTHDFSLPNGARLKIYASPYTPSEGNWGFQYRPRDGHVWNLDGADIAVTHGSPHGVLDRTANGRAGCPQLFAAIAKSRPKLHCFGHIHEGWGARLVSGQKTPSDEPTHFSDIDNDKSLSIETLASIKAGKFDTPETLMEKQSRLESLQSQKARATSHCTGDQNPLLCGEQTLFVNSSIQDENGNASQFPWSVDLELHPA